MPKSEVLAERSTTKHDFSRAPIMRIRIVYFVFLTSAPINKDPSRFGFSPDATPSLSERSALPTIAVFIVTLF